MPQLQIRISDDLSDWLAARAAARHQPQSAALRARTELEIWRSVLRLELNAFPLRREEALLLVDMCLGGMADDAVGAGLVAWTLEEVTRAYPGVYGRKWGVDEAALLARLRTAGPALDHALASAIYAYIAAQPAGDEAGALRAAGLKIVDPDPGR